MATGQGGKFPEEKQQLEGEQSELCKTRLPCFWLLLLFFPCSFPGGLIQSASLISTPFVEVGPASISIFVRNTHTLTPGPLDGGRLSRKPSQKWNWRTPFCAWRHASRAPWQALSFISVIERGFVLFMQRSVNAIGTAVFLHSPNTTVHTCICCL